MYVHIHMYMYVCRSVKNFSCTQAAELFQDVRAWGYRRAFGPWFLTGTHKLPLFTANDNRNLTMPDIETCVYTSIRMHTCIQGGLKLVMLVTK